MKMPGETRRDDSLMRQMLVQTLESLERAGVTHMPRRRPTETPASAAVTAKPPKAAVAAPQEPVDAPLADPVKPAAGSVLPLADRQSALQAMCHEVAGCTRCSLLAASRTQTVFGVGNPQARLCFVGEAPGADEDAQGIPFVGKAGQLLTKIIEACKLQREDVYILNVLKCRPPNNRPPEPDEISNCRGFLERQLAIIQPEFICCLGATAGKALLNSSESIGQLRGRFHSYQGIPVLCTYHPSYLLRNPNAKRDVWEDMKKLMREMGVELS